MPGHNGYGHTRGGRLPKAQPMALPEIAPLLPVFAGIAKKGAEQAGMTVREFCEEARKAGVLDCNDEAVDAICTLAAM